MKIALHFDADYPSFRGFYGFPIETHLFRVILKKRSLHISSKMFVGDLPMHSQARVCVLSSV